MGMEINAIKIERFKALQSLEIELKDITILIGGNNSGKSSFLQGIHFAVTTLQSARIAGTKAWSATTLGADQFLYKPADNLLGLNYRKEMTQASGPKFTFEYKQDPIADPASFELKLWRGKNANISLTYNQNEPFFLEAANRKKPISIFVPGLAGITLREEKRALAILTTGIAQGDSNLYLRNVLLGIIHDPDILSRFHTTLQSIFPGLTISSDYNEEIHSFIPINVNLDKITLPLEMIGTGCLQAIQLVAYAAMYVPNLLLLDEPDSHLHPSNQRLLAETLLAITKRFDTKVILSTHSRHMFDALGKYDECQVVWLIKGQKQNATNHHDLSLLLDLGALDSFELIGSGKNRVVVLTEDTKTKRLEFLLESNGFKRGEYLIQPFHGVDNIKSAFAVADFFVKLGSNTHVLIHRDGDCLQDDEKKWLATKYKLQLPERTELFITPLTDIEHQFCQASHLAKVYGMDINQAERFISDALSSIKLKSVIDFTNKRNEAKNKILKGKDNITSATEIVGQETDDDLMLFKISKGKTIFGHFLQALTKADYNCSKLETTFSDALEIQILSEFSANAWQAKKVTADLSE